MNDLILRGTRICHISFQDRTTRISQISTCLKETHEYFLTIFCFQIIMSGEFSSKNTLSKTYIPYGMGINAMISFFSLLLFNVVVEASSIFVNQFQSKGWLQGFPISGLQDRISVLQFANNTILFQRRTADVASWVLEEIPLTLFGFLHISIVVLDLSL